MFPHPSLANEQGLLAIGGDLSRERLLLAYEHGIFPWNNPSEPVLWWHPNPRFVIFPESVKIAKSMRSYFNQEKYTVTFDEATEDVMLGCKFVPRKGNPGTWLSTDFMDAYMDLKREGYVHSVEVWNDEKELVGGLYGVSMGNVFYGESMFSKQSNASKFALISLAKILEKKGFSIIDCQMPNDFLASMGGEFISQEVFLNILEESKKKETLLGDWSYMTKDICYSELIKG